MPLSIHRMDRRTPQLPSSLDWAPSLCAREERGQDGSAGALGDPSSARSVPLGPKALWSRGEARGRRPGICTLCLKSVVNILFNVLGMYSALVLGMLISPCAVVFPFRFLFSVFPFSSVLLLGKGRAVSSGFSSFSRHLPWVSRYHICIEGAEAKNRSFVRRARAPAGSAGNTASH